MAYPVVSAPYGLKPVNLLGGQVFAGSTRMYQIPYAYGTSIFFGDLKPAVLHRLHAGSHAVMDKGIHMASFFAGHVILDIEAFDFTSKMRREGTCIETCDGGNTRSASQ